MTLLLEALESYPICINLLLFIILIIGYYMDYGLWLYNIYYTFMGTIIIVGTYYSYLNCTALLFS